MNPLTAVANRRGFLRGSLALGTLAFTTPGLFAEQLMGTPSLTEGPFYPDRLPLDTDNDLLIINDHVTPAVRKNLCPCHRASGFDESQSTALFVQSQ